jgi:hypothetical protein
MWRRVVSEVGFSVLDETLLYQITRLHPPPPNSKVFMADLGLFLTLVDLVFVQSVG